MSDSARPAVRRPKHAAPRGRTRPTSGDRQGPAAEGVRFLLRRGAVLAALAGWSVLEAAQTFLTGYALARSLDGGFLAGRTAVGLAWLGAAAAAVIVGAFGTGRVYRAVAALTEPLRDGLVRRVVTRGLHDAVRAPHRADTAAVSRLTHQVEIARDTFAGVVMVARSFLFTAAGALLGLFALAPALLLVVVPPLLLGLGLFAATLRPMARRQEAFLVADEAVSEEVGRLVAGVRDITAAGAEERMARAADARIEAELRAARSLARWGVLRVLALGVGGRLPVVLLLVAAPWLLSHGVGAGALVGAFVYLTQSLAPALQSLLHGLGTAGSRLAVVVRRLAGDGTPTAPVAPPEPVPAVPPEPVPAASPSAPAVELRGLTFAYGAHAEPVVENLTLSVPVGGHLAVVGPSGIGKSTLAGLVAGLLRPHGGEVVVRGGRPVLVPQEAYVFTGTLRDNLRYLCPDAHPDARSDAHPGAVTDAAVLASARAVGLDGLLCRLGGLDATVDPAALSAGERQLVALARAHLAPAPVVLLDEATCHLDPAAEARAERAFAARPGGTLVVVAHRISSARRADRVLVMDGVEAVLGGHGELMERSPLYRDLVGDWSVGGRSSLVGPGRRNGAEQPSGR
ncbi:ATP-binding cassette domain-containing protein [Streptomyces sp. URMC 123]|uniref:ATP-binding cassette domain-containing protein n=1 Tax=Streptomyces sp. URMC 123 TaxID=3423403 RepID=UPI003F1D71E8